MNLFQIFHEIIAGVREGTVGIDRGITDSRQRFLFPGNLAFDSGEVIRDNSLDTVHDIGTELQGIHIFRSAHSTENRRVYSRFDL